MNMPENNTTTTTALTTTTPAKPVRKPRLTKKSVVKMAEDELIKNSRDALTEYWKGMIRNLKADSKWAYDTIGEAFGYRKAAGGINIFNQFNAQNNGSDGPRRASFESMVRRAEKADIDAQPSGPLATEDEDSDIIDVTDESAEAEAEAEERAAAQGADV